ncbi:MAG: FAD/NAD(P)-binding protein, partial [Sinobacteraceae bacterium]|nr:FAD/NAD(P)-binding protein [Nevskiaceae bacterium]
MSTTRTIAIVGAGFCGTLTAAHLLRAPHRQRTRIVLIERTAAIGRGTAYAKREHGFLLNVPAARMSADSQRPLDFLQFAQQRLPHVTAEDYLPRALYGEYLEATLLNAEKTAPSHVRCERLRAEVHAVEPKPASATLFLRLADGQTLLADDVVLALGNPPPGEPVTIPHELCQQG